MTTIVQQQAPNFESIKRAFENGDVALLECQLKATGETVAVITAVNREGDEFGFVPPRSWGFQCLCCFARVETANGQCWNCGIRLRPPKKKWFPMD